MNEQNSRVYLVVQGGVLPRQPDGDMAVPLAPAEDAGVLVECLPQLLEGPAGSCFSACRPSFRMRLDLAIGTVDELVATYRRHLEQAVAMMANSLPNTAGGTAKNLADARRLGYVPGKSLHRSLFTYRDTVVQQYDAQRQAAAEAVREVAQVAETAGKGVTEPPCTCTMAVLVSRGCQCRGV